MDHRFYAQTADESAERETIRATYLELFVTTQSQYKARLVQKSRGIHVPLIKGAPILLTEEEIVSEEGKLFIR